MSETATNPFQDSGSAPWMDFQGQKQSAPADGPWNDFAAASPSHGPWDDFATGETVMNKTAEGAGPATPPPTFKSAPTWGPTDAAEDLSPTAKALAGTRLDRTITGALNTGAGINQTLAHGAAYISPELGGSWAKSADDLAKWYADHAAESKARAGLKPQDIDWYNTAGNLATGLAPGLSAARAMGAAKTALGVIGRGALVGAGTGASQPVTSGDYASEKAKQTAIGAAAGAVPGIGAKIVSPALSAGAANAIAKPAGYVSGAALGHTTGVPYLGEVAGSHLGRQYISPVISRYLQNSAVPATALGTTPSILAAQALARQYGGQ